MKSVRWIEPIFTQSEIKMGDRVCPTKGNIDFHFKTIHKESETNHQISKVFDQDQLFQLDDKTTYFKANFKEQSEFIMACIRAMSLIIVGQHMDWNQRNTLFRSGVSRMTTLVIFTSDQEEILHTLYMCTSTA